MTRGNQMSGHKAKVITKLAKRKGKRKLTVRATGKKTGVPKSTVHDFCTAKRSKELHHSLLQKRWKHAIDQAVRGIQQAIVPGRKWLKIRKIGVTEVDEWLRSTIVRGKHKGKIRCTRYKLEPSQLPSRNTTSTYLHELGVGRLERSKLAVSNEKHRRRLVGEPTKNKKKKTKK